MLLCEVKYFLSKIHFNLDNDGVNAYICLSGEKDCDPMILYHINDFGFLLIWRFWYFTVIIVITALLIILPILKNLYNKKKKRLTKSGWVFIILIIISIIFNIINESRSYRIEKNENNINKVQLRENDSLDSLNSVRQNLILKYQELLNNNDSGLFKTIGKNNSEIEKLKTEISNPTLKQILDDKYPDGYVTFGIKDGDYATININYSDVKFYADWSKVKFILSEDKKNIRVIIPEIHLKKEASVNIVGGSPVTGDIIGATDVTLPYIQGVSISASPFFFSGMKNIHFEYLSNKITKYTIYVLGLKVANPDSPYRSKVSAFSGELKMGPNQISQ